MTPRRAQPSSSSVRRTCPSCSRRWDQLVAPDCPHCDGNGYLILGRPAQLRYPAEVVSRTIEYALELRAQVDMRVRDVDLAAARRNQTVMVNRLAAAGFLAPRGSAPEPVPVALRVGSPEDVSATVRALASEVADLEDQPGTFARLGAPPADVGAVPVDMVRPGFSRAGYVAYFARALDPRDALAPPAQNQRVAIERTSETIARSMFHER